MVFWGWQWHQLDHMQTICTSLQRDNHTNIITHFYRSATLPDAQPTVSKALQAYFGKKTSQKTQDQPLFDSTPVS